MIDVLIEMDKIQSFFESGRCEVYSEDSANSIAEHLRAHGYECEINYDSTPLGEYWLIKKTEVSE